MMTHAERKESSRADIVFDQLKAALDRACAIKDYQIALDAATAAGLQRNDVSRGFSMRLEFYGSFAGGAVTLEFRSFDQSQTFSIRPDMNRFALRLLADDQQLRHHANEFED